MCGAGYGLQPWTKVVKKIVQQVKLNLTDLQHWISINMIIIQNVVITKTEPEKV